MCILVTIITLNLELYYISLTHSLHFYYWGKEFVFRLIQIQIQGLSPHLTLNISNSIIMKPVKEIGHLLTGFDVPKAFEIQHQFKLLKIQNKKLEEKLMRAEDDKVVREQHLSSTIQDLKESYKKIRSLRRVELAETEKLIKFEASKLQQITNAMTSSMAYIDRDYKYRYINYKYTEWFGLTREDVIGKTIKEVAGEQFFNYHKLIYSKVFSGQSFNLDIETKAFHTNLRLVIKTAYIPAYDLDGNNIGLYLYGTDITENRIQNEKITKSKQELKVINERLKKYIESNAQLENFAHIAAHDMKAPLRTISSFSQMLRNRLHDSLEQKEKNFFSYIKTGTDTLNDLITDLLNYSKIDSKGLELEEVNMKKVVDHVKISLAALIEEKKAIVEVISEMPTTIMADRIKITQLVQNLVNNSLKFIPVETVPNIKIWYKENRTHHLISVDDNGIGMDKQNIKLIFEPFKQLNSKSSFEGTGLGLSICKKIVHDHNGEITVESELGKGTCFTFSLIK